MQFDDRQRSSCTAVLLVVVYGGGGIKKWKINESLLSESDKKCKKTLTVQRKQNDMVLPAQCHLDGRPGFMAGCISQTSTDAQVTYYTAPEENFKQLFAHAESFIALH